MYVNLYVARFLIQPNNFSVIINFFVCYPITMNLLPTFLCRIMSLLCMMQSRRLNIKNSLHYRGRSQSVNNKRTMQNRRRMMSPLGKLPFLRFRSLWVCTEQKANVISKDSTQIIIFLLKMQVCLPQPFLQLCFWFHARGNIILTTTNTKDSENTIKCYAITQKPKESLQFLYD